MKLVCLCGKKNKTVVRHQQEPYKRKVNHISYSPYWCRSTKSTENESASPSGTMSYGMIVPLNRTIRLSWDSISGIHDFCTSGKYALTTSTIDLFLHAYAEKNSYKITKQMKFIAIVNHGHNGNNGGNHKQCIYLFNLSISFILIYRLSCLSNSFIIC